MKNLTAKSHPGDLFYIPAFDKDGKCGIVIARYIELMAPNVGHIIEIFNKHYKSFPTNITEVDMSTRLLRPVMFDMYFKDIPRWKVLFSDSEYEKSQSDYKNISFAFYFDAWVGGRTVKASKEQLKDMEESTCWGPEHLIFIVNAYLAGIFAGHEQFRDEVVPPEQQVDNPSAYARVIDLAKSIDKKMKTLAIELKRKPKIRFE